jgi:arylsulfatase
MKYPSLKRFPGGASDDMIPDLQHPNNPKTRTPHS